VICFTCLLNRHVVLSCLLTHCIVLSYFHNILLFFQSIIHSFMLTIDIAGVPGTGKTATVHQVISELATKHINGVRHIIINIFSFESKRLLYNSRENWSDRSVFHSFLLSSFLLTLLSLIFRCFLFSVILCLFVGAACL